MLMRIAILVASAVTISCAGEPKAAGSQTKAASAVVPRGASIGSEGHATITHAPPARFTPAPPGPQQPLPPQQLAGHEQFRRAAEFQNQVMDEVQALADTLRTAERGNFVDLYYENEGEPHVVFRFLRDAPETLAKYTQHPRFRAATARFSNEELRAAMNFMLETFGEDRVIQGGGLGNKRNRAEIEINVTEPEFRALVAKKGVTIPEGVELTFRATRPANAINTPLPPEIARLLRIFPRDDRPIGTLHAINSRAKVVLQDGCFRVSGGDHNGALVLFPLGGRLFVDQDGYLAFGQQEVPGYARVGEELVFPGSIGEVTAPKLVEPIHEACGAGKVVKITGMRSAAADRVQETVTTNANSLRQLQDFYGLPEPAARKALDACANRMGFGTCMLSPPPPVMRQEDCPPGTRLSGGLCRTPEGHIRPIPKWIQELLQE